MKVTIEKPRNLKRFYIYEINEHDPIINKSFKDYQEAYHYAIEKGYTIEKI